ncbi:MAG: pyridoxal kinase, partial [Hyphomicrobiales bacterium]|nr:pyridoxal kinase [Hyphomicrobiales bacterium]
VGGKYRPESIAAAIRDRLIPLADIATPNRYELAWLTGTEARDHADLVRMAGALGPCETVVTSAFAPPGRIGNLLVTGRETVLVANGLHPNVPHGTGDLFSALYFGHRLDGFDPPLALEHAAQATRGLIDLAREQGDDEMPLSGGQDLFPAPSSDPAAVAENRTDDQS